MVMFDTNVILRYVLNDNEEMADRAEKYILDGNVWVTVEVIAEVVYVLNGFYELDRKEVVSFVKDFLDVVECKEKDVLKLALDTYEGKKLDFVDCVLYAYHQAYGWDIATFDRKLLRLLMDDCKKNEGD